MSVALYRLYGADGQLLYLGITTSPNARWKMHSDRQPWWHLVAQKSVEWHPDWPTARAAELRQIEEESPLYNRASVKQDAVVRYDDTDDLRRVAEWLAKRVGELAPGSRIWTGDTATACDVSRLTAGKAMHRFAEEDGRLEFVLHGRYVVKPQRGAAAA